MAKQDPHTGPLISREEAEALARQGVPIYTYGTRERDRYNRPGFQAEAYYAAQRGGGGGLLWGGAIIGGVVMLIILLFVL